MANGLPESDVSAPVSDGRSDGAAPRSAAAGLSRAAWRHHGLLSLFVFLWGSNFVLAETALREMTPISFSAARFLVGASVLVSLFYIEEVRGAYRQGTAIQLFPALRWRDVPRLVVVAVLGGALAPWLGIKGLEFTHSARAALWLALGPTLSTGVGMLLGTERVGRLGMAGAVVAGVGTALLAVSGVRAEESYWLGDLLLLAALLATVADLHLTKPLAARYGTTPIAAAWTSLGGLLYGTVALPALTDEPWLALGAWTWIAILAGGAIGVGLGRWVKIRALDTLGPTRVVVYGNLVPLATALVAWLALGQVPSTFEIVAGPLIIAGSFGLQLDGAPTARPEQKQEARPESGVAKG